MKLYRKPSSIHFSGTTGVVPAAAVAAFVGPLAAALSSAQAVAAASAAGAVVGGTLARKMMGDDIIAYQRRPALVPIC